MESTREKKILLLTHGGWGMSLVKAVTMILGEVHVCEEIPLKAEYTFQEYYDLVNESTSKMAEGSLILTDLIGGSTTNVAARIGYEKNIKVITGLNAPLLIEACSQLQFQGELDYEALLEVGKGSCQDAVAEVLKVMKGEK